MPNPNKIARVDLNSVLFWTAQVYDRAFGRLACESCAVIDRASSKNADVTSLCVAKAGGFPYSLLFLSRPIPSPD